MFTQLSQVSWSRRKADSPINRLRRRLPVEVMALETRALLSISTTATVTEPPVTGTTSTYTSPVTVDFSNDAPVTDATITFYRVSTPGNVGTFKTGDSVTLSTPGADILTYYTFDDTTSTVGTVGVTSLTVAPATTGLTTTATVTEPPVAGTTSTYTSPVTVVFTNNAPAMDQTMTLFRVSTPGNIGTFQSGNAVTLTTPGVDVLTYFTFDSTTNIVGTVGVQTLTVAPGPASLITTATVAESPIPGTTSVYASPVVVNFTNNAPATDQTLTLYRDTTVAGLGSFQIGNQAILTTPGPNVLTYFTVDTTTNTVGAVGVTVLTVAPSTSNVNLTLTATPSTLWPPNHKLRPVTITGTFAGTLSSPAMVSFSVTDEFGNMVTNGIASTANGRLTVIANPNGTTTFGFVTELAATRLGTEFNGRTYTIMVNATDSLGNPLSGTTMVVVPHDMGHNG